MDLIQESYQRLFPEKEFSYITKLEYNRRLSAFNANIKLHRDTIFINLNLQWKDIDNEIKIGLMQHLLLKIFKKKNKTNIMQNTSNIALYNNFVRNIPLLTPKTKTDWVLEASFERVNEKFFQKEMEKPNLTWGQNSKRKLASYNFHDDTVSVSTLFKDAREEVLDYLMYHELLHKYHKFKHNNGRSAFHTTAFRKDEKQYPHFNEIEKEINLIIRGKRSLLSFFR
ncbi:MAG: hypothetical protein ABIH82_04105 [Candidatus Woesearchaeota archaeon]